MTHRLTSFDPRSRQRCYSSTTFPKWLAEQKAAALNAMPAMVKDGIVWSAVEAKAGPVVRPSYAARMRGEE